VPPKAAVTNSRPISQSKFPLEKGKNVKLCQNNKSSFQVILAIWALMIYTVAGKEKQLRNPFMPLQHQIKPQAQPSRSNTAHPSGLERSRIEDVKVRGILLTEDLRLAVLTLENKPSYIVRTGSRLFDGVVLLIAEDGVLFLLDGTPSNAASTIFKHLLRNPRQ
jgi:hypothetical protein